MAWGAGQAAAAAPPPPPPPVPKLVVVIVVDQFSSELYARYRDRFTGGLKRLGQGVAFATSYQSHAATETCPGHSTILTGRHPAATGIVANNWFDVKTGSSIYCVAVRGTADPDARGPQNLRVATLGDWMKAAHPGSRVVAISGKDRAAIMLGGHHADAVYWWNDGAGFTTSSFAGPASAAVLAPAKRFDAALFAKWRATPPALWPSASSPDCRALEAPHTFGKLAISGAVPPDASKDVESGEDFLARTDFQDQLRASPAFDPLALDFAAQVMTERRLGHGPDSDLLAISLSSTDYVGHRYGNGGAEMCAQLEGLDRALGAFLAKVDSLGVPYAVVLTADHGAIDSAERESARNPAARRIDGAALVKGLNDHLKQALGLTYDPIVGDDPQQLFINIPAGDPTFRARLRDSAIGWLKTRDEVAEIFTADQIEAAAPPPGKAADKLTTAERFHESYDRDRSGDIIVALAPFASVGVPRVVGDVVAGHGSPWDYDRQVPILFWWPGIAAEQRTDPAETVDIAPTLAAILRLPAPAVDGHCRPLSPDLCPAENTTGRP